MKTSRLFLLLTILLISGVSRMNAASFADETLHYVITYKWGLIHKEAGTATLSLRNVGDEYRLKLTGKTKPWADKIYHVRDTLTSTVAKQGFRPRKYVKSAHEDGKFSRDEIRYSYSGNRVTGECHRLRVKKGKSTTAGTVLTASGGAYDMLSIFYFLRTLNYDNLSKGKVIVTTVFSGKKKETLKIRSLGMGEVKMKDGKKRKALHIRFNFTSDGGKKSSDDIDAWLTPDNRRVPLVLIGKLPIGSVRCYLTD